MKKRVILPIVAIAVMLSGNVLAATSSAVIFETAYRANGDHRSMSGTVRTTGQNYITNYPASTSDLGVSLRMESSPTPQTIDYYEVDPGLWVKFANTVSAGNYFVTLQAVDGSGCNAQGKSVN